MRLQKKMWKREKLQRVDEWEGKKKLWKKKDNEKEKMKSKKKSR